MLAATFTAKAGAIRAANGRLVVLRAGDRLPPADDEDVLRLVRIGAAVLDHPPVEQQVTHPMDAGDLREWMLGNQPTIADVLEQVGDNPDAARVALETEDELTSGEPRKRLVARLTEIIEGV